MGERLQLLIFKQSDWKFTKLYWNSFFTTEWKRCLDENRTQVLWFTRSMLFHCWVPFQTNENEERAIIRVAIFAPRTQLAFIRSQLLHSRHSDISSEIISRWLADTGIKNWRPLRYLPLPHIKSSVDGTFADPGQSEWAYWRRVIFSDKSRLSLSVDDYRTCLWRWSG